MGKGDRKTRKGKRFIGSRKKRTKMNCYGITPKTQKKIYIMNYKQEIDYAIKNTIATFGDIFDFEETPNEKFYKDLYLFCRENLDIHFMRKTLPQSTFLYSTDLNVNAKAIPKKNAIIINMGLINNCIKKYLYNHDLNDFIESKEPALAAKFDSSLSYLAFQVNTQFTYYHELAHLFQFSKNGTEQELQERSIDGGFDIMKHKLEINADTYSSICIATHIDQYIDKSFGEHVSQEIVTKTITIFGACLLEYIVNFTDKFELYFEEHSHPHPLIRLLNIILNITNHFSLIPKYKEKEIKLEPIALFRNIIDFHEELENNNVFTTGFSKSISQYTANIPKIVSYTSTIIDLGDDNGFTDAMSIWNEHVETID